MIKNSLFSLLFLLLTACPDSSAPPASNSNSTTSDEAAATGVKYQPESPFTPCWIENNNNPVIGYDMAGNSLIWNDPSVIKEGDNYRMWLSGGTGLGINFVKIYQALSTDGINWTINTTPQLAPASDDLQLWVETGDSSFHGVYQLNKQNPPVYKRLADYNGMEWNIFIDNDEYFLSGTTSGDGPGLGIDSWKCVDNDPFSYPNCPLGNYQLHSGSGISAFTILAVDTGHDTEKTETPSVIKVGSTYHMYYSSLKIGEAPGRYQIGHATSTDGINWTRDSTPVLVYHDDPNKWGFYHVAEPGAVYNPVDGKIYLYYTTSRGRSGYTGDLASQQAIAVAVSTDGKVFKKSDNTVLSGATVAIDHQVAFTQTESYPVSSNYNGYSTPFALIDSKGIFHLFHDVVQFPSPGDWRQVALARATSQDGFNFKESEKDIFTFNNGDWKNHEVRAPAVIEESGEFKMWFAGNNEKFFQPDFKIGIGYSIYDDSLDSCYRSINRID
jgi:hypothetical protein